MKKMQKIVAIILAMCNFGTTGVFASASGFKDVSEVDWFYPYVINVSQKNILKGADEKTFRPQKAITRAEFVAAIGKLKGIDTGAYQESSFSDVNAKDEYSSYIEWAVKTGIVTGTKKGVFSPKALISREQTAAILQRFVDLEGYTVSTEDTLYSDMESISEYAKLSVAVCTNAGFLTGDSEGFKPKSDITRAETAAVFTRLEDYITKSQKTKILNAEDQKKVNTAIKALKKPIKTETELLKDIYNVAFSKNFSLSGSAKDLLDKVFTLKNEETGTISKETVTLMEMAVKGIYGGAKIENIPGRYFGEKKEEISASDFVTGDILVIEASENARMYIYDGKAFSPLAYETTTVTIDEVLAALKKAERFVTLRPSYVMHDINDSLPYKDENLTDEQKAVVETAENYLLRGYRVQYSDTRMQPWPGEFRWHFGVKSPEDYTIDEWGYTNCAAFATDVHRTALGWNSDIYATWQLAAAGYMRTFYYTPTGKETAAERQKIEEECNKNLIAGDIIVIRRGDGSGHAMLYVGNGNIIHSSGSNYNYTKKEEKYEPSIRYLQLKDLFTPKGGEKRFVFAGKVTELAVVRPIGMWTGAYPKDSIKRIENLKGIVSEKLSSHSLAKTVNAGEEMTFTFSIYNTNDFDVTLSVSDVVPQNTTYVSGAEKKDGKNLSWTVKVPANESREVSYKVRVESDAKENAEVLSSEGKVGGVSVNCCATKIKNTLTKNQQNKLADAVSSFDFSGENQIENLNSIYQKAFSAFDILSAKTPEELASGLFEERSDKKGYYDLKTSGKLSEMIAPTLFGGRKLYAKEFEYKIKGVNYRTRLVKKEHLVAGDVVVAFDKEAYTISLYQGEALVDLKTGETLKNTEKYLEGLLGTQLYFAVLRPSFVMK